ncbi:MAG: hypothetical protein ACUVYA_08055 [Planctomycetota bacterium]
MRGASQEPLRIFRAIAVCVRGLSKRCGLARAERRRRAKDPLERFGLAEKADAPFGSLSRRLGLRFAGGARLG